MNPRLTWSMALVALALLVAFLGCASSATTTATTAAPTSTLSGTPSRMPTGTDPSGASTPTATPGTRGGGGSAPTAPPTPPPIQGTDFVITATSANSVGAETDLNAVATNNNPNAILIVVAALNPGGKTPIYDPHPLGVYYHDGKWAIFHEDKAGWISGASYNVRVLAPSSRAFIVQISSANISADGVTIDSPAANFYGAAVLLVTPLWRSNGPLHPGIYDPHPLGIGGDGKSYWHIVHEDGASWVNGALYNIQVLDSSPKNFTLEATSSNGIAEMILINSTVCDGNPHALIFVTPRWAEGGPHVLGVMYTGEGKWAVFNEDRVFRVYGADYFISVT